MAAPKAVLAGEGQNALQLYEMEALVRETGRSV
jgi:hypothetical protein